jgi:hypothetical protein
MSHATLNDLQTDSEKLRAAVALVAEFVSDTILDPHSGLQSAYTGAGQYTDSNAELIDLLAQLLETLDIIGFSASRLEQLDRRLQDQGIPPLSTLSVLCAAPQSPV